MIIWIGLENLFLWLRNQQNSHLARQRNLNVKQLDKWNERYVILSLFIDKRLSGKDFSYELQQHVKYLLVKISWDHRIE